MAPQHPWSPDIWTGRWRWLAETALYTDPERQIKSQVADIHVKDGRLLLKQRFELLDGTRLAWTWDGAFDGVMRPITWDHDGSEMIDIAFFVLREGLCGDVYSTKDGRKAGAEYFTVTPAGYSVWGCYTVDNQHQYPYRESWAAAD